MLGALSRALAREGLIAFPCLTPTAPSMSYAAVEVSLHQTLTEPVVSAVEASLRAPATPVPDPVAVMPVWAFEPADEEGDVQLASAQLWGVDLKLEALRVHASGSGWSAAAARRLERLGVASYTPGDLTSLPGQEGEYAILAYS